MADTIPVESKAITPATPAHARGATVGPNTMITPSPSLTGYSFR